VAGVSLNTKHTAAGNEIVKKNTTGVGRGIN